ncbi:hypothetical protein S83_001487, partial [Arachis hypogaea]
FEGVYDFDSDDELQWLIEIQKVLEISYVRAKLGKSFCRKVSSCRSFHWVHALLVWVFKGCVGQLLLISIQVVARNG